VCMWPFTTEILSSKILSSSVFMDSFSSSDM
jgi:hypothetical protein